MGVLLQLAHNSPSFRDQHGLTFKQAHGGVSVADPQAIRNIRADASSDPEIKAMLRAGVEPEEAIP